MAGSGPDNRSSRGRGKPLSKRAWRAQKSPRASAREALVRLKREKRGSRQVVAMPTAIKITNTPTSRIQGFFFTKVMASAS
jgi:hypothetical protein